MYLCMDLHVCITMMLFHSASFFFAYMFLPTTHKATKTARLYVQYFPGSYWCVLATVICSCTWHRVGGTLSR